MKAILALEDGTVFHGQGFGAPAQAVGEVCFNTSMTGYQEILTDPSYKAQNVTMTYPLIGNYGVPATVIVDGLDQHFESERIHVQALVVSEYSFQYSHWNASRSLADWLIENQVPALYGIDTRMLTSRRAWWAPRALGGP